MALELTAQGPALTACLMRNGENVLADSARQLSLSLGIIKRLCRINLIRGNDMPKLTVQNRTKADSKQLIIAMAKYGNHYMREKLNTENEVNDYLTAKGLSLEALVSHCRDPKQHVPEFENLFGGAVYPDVGAAVTLIDKKTGREGISVQGPGMISGEYYWPQFEKSAKTFEESISKTSYDDFLMSIVLGIASIDSYIAHRKEIWNRNNPNDSLFDSRENKVSFDDKIDIWIPKMTVGMKFDKGDLVWQHHKILREFRDNSIIHTKTSAFALNLHELLDLAGKYRNGIGSFMFRLHLLFKEIVPTRIIRMSFYPDILITE